MLTPPSEPLPPETLLRKPGTITTAQVMLWLQFSFLICCGAGTGLVGLFWSPMVDFDDFALGQDLSEGMEDLAAVVTALVAVVIVLVILFGVLAVKIGAGRRWAQVATIIVMLATIVFGFLGLYTGFRAGDQAGVPVDGSRLVFTLLGLAMPLVTLICLFTGSANQWFRQGGRFPLTPPLPPPSFRPYL